MMQLYRPMQLRMTLYQILERVGLLDECNSGVLAVPPSPAPDVILTELNQGKMNESSVTDASIELWNRSIEVERNALEMTRKRLAPNSVNISDLQEELNRARQKLESVKDLGADGVSSDPVNFSEIIQMLSSETEEFKILGEAAKAELFSAMLEIAQKKSRIKIAEMGLAAANKIKEAARSAEEAALSELKNLTHGDCLANDDFPKPATCANSHAGSGRSERVEDKVLLKLERATAEVKMTKMVMENALRRVEIATAGACGDLADQTSLRHDTLSLAPRSLKLSDHPNTGRNQVHHPVFMKSMATRVWL
uniref:Uncharacterized protein n=1 Tax=Kalanchoe fedtschenkoi TaxID=63787 RepID=A0A7N0VBV4_KALFE